MLEDLIHGPKSSAERAEKTQNHGRVPAGPSKLSNFLNKLNAQARKAETDLFKGVQVYFTGYTDKLNVTQLKNILQKHGAITNYYFVASQTTHIVCTNLCASKLQSFAKGRKKRVFIVHPNWIIDSVKAQKALPEKDYEIIVTGDTTSILDYMTKEPKQQTNDGVEALPGAAEALPQVATSTSLNLSSDTSTSEPKEYKRSTHPLFKIRRSSPPKGSKSGLQGAHPKEKTDTAAKNGIPSTNFPSINPKQARFDSILKKSAVPRAQKSFK